MTNALEIGDAVRAAACEAGIAKFDLFGTVTSSLSVKIEEESLGQVQGSDSVAVRVRVWGTGRVPGVASTSDLSAEGLVTAVKEAQAAAALLFADDAVDFSPESLQPLQELPLAEARIEVPPSTMIDKMIGAERTLKRDFPEADSVPYNEAESQHVARFYLNSAGAQRQESFNGSFAMLLARGERSGKKTRAGSAYCMGRLFNEMNIDACVQEAGENLRSHLDYQPIAGGCPLVAFSGEAFLQLLGVFSNFVNARDLLDNRSLLSRESLGTGIASPLLSLADHARHKANLLTPISFDEEGTPTRHVSLVEKGFLTGLLHTAQTARAFDVSPTGHAVCGSKVSARPHFWVVTPATPSSVRSKTSEPSVLHIQSLEGLHAGACPQQGSFSLPFDGWMYQNGVRRSVESAVVAGDFLQLLKNIVFVGGAIDVRMAGVSPEVWVEGLSVTNEG